MSKRSHSELSKNNVDSTDPKLEKDSMSDNESGDENDMDVVDVDFDFFDPKEIDFHAIKRMLISSFGDDHDAFDTSELADIIVKQKLIGSTVKASGEDDPYAFLTVLNMHELSDKNVIQQIKNYLLEKSGKTRVVKEKLAEILGETGKDVGIIFNERLMNMPVQVVPPMFKMLFEELEWAIADKERYDFEWYIMTSPIYKEIAPTGDSDGNKGDMEEEMPGYVASGSKKSRISDKTFYFHPEDEFIEEFVDYKFDYKFSKKDRAPDSRNSFAEFGLSPLRRCFIVHKSKLIPIHKKLESVFAP
ncbi:hypothetical protein BB559_006690 [Furculomyces boomerangus]|uniref:Protein BCP1 n=2 Tax=Harpellales TaxID=61421 RepID=A0A2T9Y120_9FUNG|nr:hypothetical protein BB559_006690 [Furculomyces boomerangus]PVZ99701.1 hypothetical protein BB558_004265 [Smittium angustum]